MVHYTAGTRVRQACCKKKNAFLISEQGAKSLLNVEMNLCIFVIGTFRNSARGEDGMDNYGANLWGMAFATNVNTSCLKPVHNSLSQVTDQPVVTKSEKENAAAVWLDKVIHRSEIMTQPRCGTS